MGYIGNSNPSVTNLGGDIDVNGHQIKSSNNGNIEIIPDGSGTVKIDVLTFPVADGSNGQFLQTNGSGVLSFSSASGGIASVVADSTPQLGGNLDVNGNDIVSTSNGNIDLDPNGSGKVVFKGNSTKGSGQFVLNCEQNSHGITIKGPPHSASASYTLTLPTTDGSSGEYLKTDGSGTLSWDTPSGGGGSTGNITFSNSNISTNDQTMNFYADDNDDDAGNDTFNFYGGPTAQGRITFLIHDTANQTNQMWVTESSSTSYYSKFVQHPDKSTFYCNEGGSPTNAYALFSNVSSGGDIRLGTTTNGRVCVTEEYGSTVYYKFPRATPSSGDVLTASDGSGTLSWSAPSGGGSSNPLDFGDASSTNPTSDCIRIGAGYDMRLFHASNKSFIRIGGSVGSGGDFAILDSYGQVMIDCVAQNEVKLTHNGSNKLATAYGNANSITLSGVYTLPGADGSSGQQLTTNGSGTVTFAAASSDERLKKNVSANDMGLSFINELNTKVYTFKSYKELDASDSQLSHLKPQEYTKEGDTSTPESVKNETEDDIPYNLSTRKGEQRGLLAQEVKATLDKLGISNFKGWGEDKYGVQEIHLEEFVVPLIKAVQELSKRVEDLEKG